MAMSRHRSFLVNAQQSRSTPVPSALPQPSNPRGPVCTDFLMDANGGYGVFKTPLSSQRRGDRIRAHDTIGSSSSVASQTIHRDGSRVCLYDQSAGPRLGLNQCSETVLTWDGRRSLRPEGSAKTFQARRQARSLNHEMTGTKWRIDWMRQKPVSPCT